MKYVAGWDDGSGHSPRLFNSLEDIKYRYTEVFTPWMSLRQMITQVWSINGEGNYHEFVFRPAFECETLEVYQPSSDDTEELRKQFLLHEPDGDK